MSSQGFYYNQHQGGVAMSSGTRFDYTAEERSVLLGQFSDVMKYAHEQLRPAARISLVLEAAISDDDVVVVPKIVQSPDGRILHVIGDPKIRTAAGAIEATGCKVKWGLAETPARIPMTIQPVDCRARLFELGEVRTAEQIYNLYPKILTPAEFFALGAKFPKEQEDGSIATVWLDATGRFFYAGLLVHGDGRGVYVHDC